MLKSCVRLLYLCVQVELAVEGGETVEPILDAFAGYSADTTAALMSIVGLYMFMIFRVEMGLPALYSIREQDMFYYLLFTCITVGFQTFADVFLHNVQELFHGWKLYDYLVYTRYRFLQRETRWKGLEDSLDECIEEGMRTLDQMCFSSQYYMMITIHAMSIMLIVFGVNIQLRGSYNFFGDPGLPILFLATVVAFMIFKRVLILAADLLGVWRIKHANTAWHSSIGNEEDDDFLIPKWDELEKLKGASHEEFLMNQKITSETFRHRFLDYNRPWLVAQLPSILTPRTLRRSRPFVLAQLSKLLGTINPDISSDSSEEEAQKKFGPITLDSASRTMIRLWLAQARRRMRLREVVQPLITRARKQECEQCLSRRQLQVRACPAVGCVCMSGGARGVSWGFMDGPLAVEGGVRHIALYFTHFCVRLGVLQVELMIPIDVMGDRFEAENPDMEEFDQVAWKAFWEKHQKYRTICMACITRRNMEKRDAALVSGGGDGGGDEPVGPQFGPVFLSAASKAIMAKWYGMVRRRTRSKNAGASPKRSTALAVSSDDEDEDHMAAAPWARKPVKVTASSRAIAVKWLQLARFQRSQGGGGGGGAPTVQEIEDERVKRVQASSGTKSRYGRK